MIRHTFLFKFFLSQEFLAVIISFQRNTIWYRRIFVNYLISNAHEQKKKFIELFNRIQWLLTTKILDIEIGFEEKTKTTQTRKKSQPHY